MRDDAVVLPPDAAIIQTRSTMGNVFSLHLSRRAGCGRHHHHASSMEIAAVHAIAELARQCGERRRGRRPTECIQDLAFGAEYIIPGPFDPRLIVEDRPGGGEGGHGFRCQPRPSPTSRRTASGCWQFTYHSGTLMQPISCGRCAQFAGQHSRIVSCGRRRVKTSACFGPCRSRWMRSSHPRSAVGLVRRSSSAPSSATACVIRVRGACLRGQPRQHDERFRRVLAGLIAMFHRAPGGHGAIRQARDAPTHRLDRLDAV